MEQLNYFLFSLINASSQASGITVAAAGFVAQWFAPAAAAMVIALWVWGVPVKRGALVAVGVGVIIGLAINQVIGILWFHPRPFMVGVGRTLISHSPETSFPSDHATFLWSLGFGLIATKAWRWWGWMLTAWGVAVAWARIYLGVHFPFDMAGSLLVSLVAAAFAFRTLSPIQHWLLPPIETIYNLALRYLRLPPAVFPRTLSPFRTQSPKKHRP